MFTISLRYSWQHTNSVCTFSLLQHRNFFAPRHKQQNSMSLMPLLIPNNNHYHSNSFFSNANNFFQQPQQQQDVHCKYLNDTTYTGIFDQSNKNNFYKDDDEEDAFEWKMSIPYNFAHFMNKNAKNQNDERALVLYKPQQQQANFRNNDHDTHHLYPSTVIIEDITDQDSDSAMDWETSQQTRKYLKRKLFCDFVPDDVMEPFSKKPRLVV